MQKILMCLCLCVWLCGAAKYESLSTLTPGNFERQLEIPPTEPLLPNTKVMKNALDTYAKLPFDIGERIRFLVVYLGVKAGNAEYIVQPPIKWENSWAHRITGEVKNADWFAWMVTIHDSVECLFSNTSVMEPLRFYINQQEPVSFRQSKVLDFSIKNAKVSQITQRKDRKQKSEEFPLAFGTKDAVASFFYFRENIHIGDGKDAPIKFPIFTSEKTWEAAATWLKQETITVEGYEYDTDLYQLKTHFGAIMEQKGDMLLWLTRDSRRLPVQVDAHVKFGHVKLYLQEWEQGNADPLAKKIYPNIKAK